MKKAALGFIALAMSVMATTAQAYNGTGDIRALDPCDEYGYVIPNGSMANPYTVGQTAYFRIRLENVNSKQSWITQTSSMLSNPWSFELNRDMYPLADETTINRLMAQNPPKVGVWVSGSLRYANVLSIGVPEGKGWYTDIICSYTVQPGDLAFPMALASTEGKKVGEGSSKAYRLLNVGGALDPWKLVANERESESSWGTVTATNVVCSFWWSDKGTGNNCLDNTPDTAAERQTWNSDWTLEQAGLYIKTVDFSAPEYFVAKGRTENVTVNIEGGVNTNGTGVVYAKVKDGEAVSLAESSIEVIKMWDGSASNSYQVAKVMIPSGEDITSFAFKVQGVAESDKPAVVYLSSTKEFTFDDKYVITTNFVMATVKCTAPPPPYITVTLDDAAEKEVTASPNYKDSVAKLSVKLSEPHTSDVTVQIAATMVSGTSVNPLDKYIGVSAVNNKTAFLDKTLSVTFTAEDMANGILSKDLYVYVIGGDDDSAKGIRFSPVEVYPYNNNQSEVANLYINKCTPKIESPVEGRIYSGLPGGVKSPFYIKIADDFSNMQQEFEVEWQKTGSGTPETIKATPNADDEIKVEVRYNAGEYTTAFRVKNAAGAWSEWRNVQVKVNPAKQVSAWVEDPADMREYGEDNGELTVMFKLTEPYDNGTLYAFLVPTDAASSNLVTCNRFTTGVSIRGGDLESSGPAKIKILDGNEDSLPLVYSIVLRTSKNWGEGEVVGIYESKDLELYVNNVPPVITAVNMSGSAPVEESGKRFTGKAAIGLNKTFWLDMDDVEADYTNEVTAVWTFSSPSGNATTHTVKAPADQISLDKTFNISGVYSCSVKVQDKDMSGKKYSNVFNFEVEVQRTPVVFITQTQSETNQSERLMFKESDADSGLAFFWVKLSTPAPDKLDVVLDCVPRGRDGAFEVENKRISFKAEESEKQVFIDSLDGTMGTILRNGAVKITAEVVTATENEDGTPFSEMYQPTEIDAYIENAAPVFLLPIDSGVTSSVPMNVELPIKWQVNDVGFDLTNNLTVQVTLRYDSFTTNYVGSDVHSGVFTNIFTSTGPKEITFIATDKDGTSSEPRTLYYYVEPQKVVKVNPIHPYAGGAQSSLAGQYETARGIGAGRVWADGSSVIKRFAHEYNYNKSVIYANVSALGYLSGEKDNQINKAGDKDETQSNPYSYDDLRDSFFYAWFLYNEDPETGSLTGVPHITPMSPKTRGEPAKKAVSLPLEAAGDESNPLYAGRIVEAFFSKELYAADNMGDMNSDGIPDYYATMPWTDATGVMKTIPEAQTGQAISGSANESGGSGTASSSDLADVASYNGDGDYLPEAWGSSNPLNPQTLSWGPGEAFTVSYEIRGVAVGLNEPGVSEYQLAQNELHALYAACAAAGMPAADYAAATNWAAKTGWTPEAIHPTTGARLNPLSPDTDGDGFDDGWEYYFWYYAKFGAVVNGEWKRLEGRRFDVNAPVSGSKISADEIAEAFNPHLRRDRSVEFGMDFDNDGLTDLEEFVLGTNPCDWDSDGDGMSDLWEVMMGLNPCFADSANNPDYDFMARCDYAVDTFTLYEFANGETYALPSATGSSAPVVAASSTAEVFKVETSDSAVFWSAALPATYTYDGKTILATSVVCRANLTVDGVDYLGAEKTLAAGTVLLSVADARAPMSAAMLPETGFNWSDPKTLDASTTKTALKLFNYGGDGVTYVPCTSNITAYVDVPLDAELVNVREDMTVTLIHDQVYQLDGFDPRVAWNINENGFLDNRWMREDSDVAGTWGDAGVPTNTVAYTSRDEYLVLQYRQQALLSDYPDLTNSVVSQLYHFRTHTTFPNVPLSFMAEVEGLTYEPFTHTNATMQAYWDTLRNWLPVEDEEYTGQHGADTDRDGVPDGWELYVRSNPNSDDDASLHIDQDKLNLSQEYAGVDSCNAYSNKYDGAMLVCPAAVTITKNHPGVTDKWWNKFFPTDPHNADTDGDGLADHLERDSWKNGFPVGRNVYGSTEFTFIYGDKATQEKYLENGKSTCFRGGGLNPCTVDTDGDLLPDPWEYQYAGVVFEGSNCKVTGLTENDYLTLISADEHQRGLVTNWTHQIRGGMDGTFAGDTDAKLSSDANWDFDHDGLLNWQEYLVQSLRHLRYDDASTPLMGRDPDSLNFVRFMPFSSWDGKAFHNQCRIGGFPGLKSWDFRSLGYFALPPRKWDMVALNTTGQSSCANYASSEGAGYRVMLRPWTSVGIVRFQAIGYACTDPRLWDTDNDGMDDYYEIFHGLNPLLGSAADPNVKNEHALYNYQDYDVIAQIYPRPDLIEPITAWHNHWTGWNNEQPSFDAVKHPWMIGTMECDADGDGLRNDEESLKVNVANPKNTHTDPTPLWMTDSTTENFASFTSQYYNPDPYLEETDGYNPLTSHADLFWYPWIDINWNTWVSAPGSGGINRSWLFSFEENEGYDTDHDFKCDAVELVKGAESTSDPLNFMDPNRRQALYLPGLVDGVGSAAASYDAEFRRSVGTEPDLCKQFTVECWVRPEGEQKDVVIVERVCFYGPSTLGNSQSAVRANFRIGVDAEGYVYGEFDGSTLNSGRIRATGHALPAGVWTHLAFTFDGNVASLYMKGEVAPVASVSGAGLIPANGIDGILQGNGADVVPYTGYRALPCAVILGARALTGDAVSINSNTTWDDFGSYFKGWIDEVRVWDGARTPSDIRADYLKRYSFADVSATRDAVYKSWMNGATRASANLPPELLYHYNFASIPGGVEEKNVLTAPAGFKANVLDNVRRPDGKPLYELLSVGWWSQLAGVNSQVYREHSIVPWIANTVAHLPIMDGSSADSRYWSRNVAGVIGTFYSNVDAYDYPNTANPYPYYIYRYDRLHHLNRLAVAPYTSLMDGSSDTDENRYHFHLRSASVGTSDLVPLGGAFAKRGTDFWDGDGAMDVWTLTSKDYEAADANSDGIPDWAEELGFTSADYEEYLRALAAGLLPGATSKDDVNPLYADTADSNHDGLVDWWQRLHDLKGYAQEDADQDGLADYAEYLISDVFNFANVSPVLTRTDGNEFDYFRKKGKLYFGEMFADHDFMEDAWEVLFSDDVVDTAKYDPKGDFDHDGWSNYAECRAGTLPNRTSSVLIGSDEVADYPVPAIRIKAHYAKASSVSAPIVIKAYSSVNNAEFDAKWTVPGSSVPVNNELALGLNPGKVTSVNLGPGAVVPGSVRLLMRDPSELSVSSAGGVWQSPGSSVWREVLVETVIPGNSDVANLSKVRDPVGTINYPTAIAEIDFSQMLGNVYYNIEAGTYSFNPPNTNVYMRLNMANSFAKIEWQSIRVPGESVWNITLSKAERGHVREGLNRFEAFVDLDGDGKYTAGEPFGIARDVDVSWNATCFEIELEDMNVLPRVQLDIPGIEDDELAVSRNTRISVYRTSIDGLTSSYNGGILNPHVIDRDIGSRNYLHEGDLMPDNGFDIDWTAFTTDVLGSALAKGLYVTSVVYRVTVNSESESSDLCYSNTFEIVRRFTKEQLIATPVSVNGVNYGARPVFRWKFDSGVDQKDWDTFTAFSIQVAQGSATWDSGIRKLPPRLPNGEFEWKAPICVGDLIGAKNVFASTNNYTWRISLHNSKYQTAAWSAAQTFRMNVYGEGEANPTGYGVAKLRVKYFGPGSFDTSASKLNGAVRVAVYSTPDFSGDPLGATFVRDAVSLTNSAHEVNATIIGLESGTYYACAYIDSNGNMKRDDFESWGYACPRGDTVTKAIFTPSAIKVGDGIVVSETIYIEDADTDQDCLPDVWEYDQKKGATGFLNANVPSSNVHNGYIAVNPDLSKAIANLISANAKAYMFSAGVASVPSGLVALSMGIETAENTVEESTLAIKAIALGEGNVNLTVGAKANEPDLGTLYVKDNTVTTTIVIRYADSLNGEWKSKEFVKTFEIADGGVGCVLTITKEELIAEGLDTSKGFFKVELK